MIKFLKDCFNFDGIQDSELTPNSDWIWLTPTERLGVQCRDDAEVAYKLIEQRKKLALQSDKVRI